MNVTLFKKLYGSKDVPYVYDIDKIVYRIKNGKSKEIIDAIRIEKEKIKKQQLKNTLPCILFAGEFSERNDNSCVKHSGLMVVDFDKFPANEYESIFKKITDNPHTFLAFKSPSGFIKAVIRIPECTKLDHPKYFKAFDAEFKIPYWDSSNSNISRICFESYDPNIYVNKQAEIYNPELIDEGYNVSEYVSYTPINDEHKIIDMIMKWNWKKTFTEGQRNDFVFGLAGVFCEFGVSESTAIAYIKNNVAVGDLSGFTQKEIDSSVKNAYKKRNFGVRFFEDWEKKKKLELEIISGKRKEIKEKYNLTDQEYDKIKENAEDDIFWYFEEDNKGKQKIKVDPLKYKFFLERNGFKKYFHAESQKPTWVKIQSNKVVETSPEKIKDFVLDYLLKTKELSIWSYCANYQTLFSDSFLLMLETVELMMLKDTRNKSFIAFENGILEITKNKINLVDYIDIDGYIWESQIIKRDWHQLKTNDNQYKTFISNITNNEPLALECTIGFLLSTYKNKMNNKAVILNDEVISANPEGGTGKGLFVQGLRQIRRVSILDGKTFDEKKSFPYQTVSTETQILVFDDVKKNWDFESKFSLVTEGITLERKNKDAIKLTVEDSPKMVVSTNYAIKGEGNSHDRRRHEVEIAQYYGRKLTPYDEFGCELFDDWDDEHFAYFDNYMVYCIQAYMNNGLIEQQAKNLKLRKFIAETSMDFYEWISEFDNFPRNVRNNKSEYFTSFTNEYKDYHWLKRNTFTIWVNKYANFMNLDFTAGKSNGVRWFMIQDVNAKIEDNEDEILF
jgi:hypothetical protein